jgi:THO complex subunit 2
VKSKDIESQAAAARELVQHCILPRLFLSPKDAMYCVEFLRQIHKLGPEGLRLLSVVDRLFKEIGFMVRCCTSRESTNLGIFLADLMSLVSQWRQKSKYEKECLDVEAFKSYKSGNLESVSYDEFIRLSANWHKRLTLDVFKSCIVSEDYMQMKNVLLVLNRMVRVYPATKEDAEELLATLKPISENDPREDLKTLARMYCTGLEMSIRDRKMVDSRQEYAGLPPPAKKRISQPKEDAKQKAVEQEATPRKKDTDAENTKSEQTKKVEEEPPKSNKIESNRKRDSREKQDAKRTKELTLPDGAEDRRLQEDSRRSGKPSSSSRRDSNREANRSGKDDRLSKRKQDDISHQRRSSNSRSHDARNKRADLSSKDNNRKRDSRQDSEKREAERRKTSKDDSSRKRDQKLERRDEKEKVNNRSKDRKLAKGKEPGEDFKERSGSERHLKRSRSTDDSPPREQSKRSKSDGTRRRDRNDKSPDRNHKPQQRSRHEARDKEQSYGSRQGRNLNMSRQRSGGSRSNR